MVEPAIGQGQLQVDEEQLNRNAPVIPPIPPPGPGQGLQDPQALARQQTEVSRLEYDRLKEKEDQERRLKALEDQIQTNAAPGASHYATMKTTITVPSLEKGMSWQDYKFRVELWKQARPVPPESMGWCLINALPSNDGRCLQQRIVDAIGINTLSTKEGADQVVQQLGQLIRNPTFVRLVEWDVAWANVKQGTKTFDGFVTQVRNLAKESKEEFGLELPKGIIAAKLLGGCSQMSPENIGVITQGLDILKEGQDAASDVSRKIEEAIRKHISMVKVFSDKPHGTSHVGYAGRTDVLGQPLSPGEDLRNSLSRESGEEEHEVFAAGQKRRFERRNDEDREKMRKLGQCFECKSTEHLSYDCPKKKERLEKKRKEVEGRGEVWRGGKPLGSRVNKVNYARHVENALTIHLTWRTCTSRTCTSPQT